MAHYIWLFKERNRFFQNVYDLQTAVRYAYVITKSHADIDRSMFACDFVMT